MTSTCPECGTPLEQATIDLADRPDVDPGRDYARAEFDARSMTAVEFCPNPSCARHGQPGTDTGAQL